MKISCLAIAMSLLCATAACTQDEAEVAYKGDEFYGRTHRGALDAPDHDTYPEDSPRIKQGYSRPVEEAAVQSVGISDLPPPTPVGHIGVEHPADAQNGAAPFGSPSKAPEAPQPDENLPAKAQSEQTSDSTKEKPTKSAQFIWPVADGKLIAHFGPKAGGRSNDGVNISVAEGEPIWAAADGAVVYAGNDLKGYGNMVIIRHDGGFMTAYAHARSLSVKKGATVKQGDIIAYVGQTGGVKTPQVHFAIRNGRTPVDPELYLPKNVSG